MTIPNTPLPTAAVPLLFVPMKLPPMVLPVELPISMPFWLLPEMTLRAPAGVPPIVLLEPPSIITPSLLPRATVPVTSVPMKSPCTMFPMLISK